MINNKNCCFYATMIRKSLRYLPIFLMLFFTVFLNSCSIFSSSKKQNSEDEEITKTAAGSEINVFKKADANVEKSGGLFSSGKKNELGNNNIMWKATMQTLKDLPISVASYTGGIIQTDWYSNNTSESIKIKVEFISNEVRVSSFNVMSFKKTCLNINSENRCEISQLGEDFNSKIKNKIIDNIKKINLKSK